MNKLYYYIKTNQQDMAMTYDEILGIINKKGEVANTVFNTYMELNDEKTDFYGCDTVATFAFNCTVLLLKLISEKPSYYKEAFGLTQEELNRALKDYETMPHLYYPFESIRIQRTADAVNRDMQNKRLDGEK